MIPNKTMDVKPGQTIIVDPPYNSSTFKWFLMVASKVSAPVTVTSSELPRSDMLRGVACLQARFRLGCARSVSQGHTLARLVRGNLA